MGTWSATGDIMFDHEIKKSIEVAKKMHFNHNNPPVAIGSKLRILYMKDQPHYTNREGKLLYVDNLGQLHGTWGILAIMPEDDKFEIIH